MKMSAYESSKTITSPSRYGRFSCPTRMEHPSGTISGRWQVSRMLVEPQCGFKCDLGARAEKVDSPIPRLAMSTT